MVDRLVGQEEQTIGIDAVPPRLLGTKPISPMTVEELLERAVAQIDDLGARGIGDQPVEQLHLAAGIGDIDRPDKLGKAAGQQRLARIEIEADQRPAAVQEKLHQEPREQRLAHPRARRGDDVEGSRLHGITAARFYERLTTCTRGYRRGAAPLATNSLSLMRSYSPHTLPSQWRT